MKEENGILQPTMGLHPFDFVYRVIAIYGISVWNFVLCFFVVVMRSLSVELEEFNANFEKLLTQESIQTVEINNNNKLEKLSTQLLSSFSIHNKIARKIRKVDKIFRTYTFCMMSIGTPMVIFALITLIRRTS
uniref:Uncharacterized protein n=1 Tax=Ditylenchus dipsaci TaxID=166011 RepID=A0A915D2Q8_9BILA